MNARTPTTIDHDFDPTGNGEWPAFEPRSLREFVLVLAERMRHMVTRGELRAVEQRLSGRIDGLDGRMGELEGRMDRIEGRMDRLEVRMSGVETSVMDLSGRVSVLEERISHTATKTWVLGGVVATLLAMVGAFWWIVQQYLAPLLRAAS